MFMYEPACYLRKQWLKKGNPFQYNKQKFIMLTRLFI